MTSNSYAASDVSSNGQGGGGFAFLTGSQYPLNGDIESSYSIGKVPGGNIGGGFACEANPYLSNDYWNETTSGAQNGECDGGNNTGIKGVTSKQLRSGLPAGFDPKIWAEKKGFNNGFPYLIANPPAK